eukprot:462178-Prymnesium_polylepis.1
MQLQRAATITSPCGHHTKRRHEWEMSRGQPSFIPVALCRCAASVWRCCARVRRARACGGRTCSSSA